MGKGKIKIWDCKDGKRIVERDAKWDMGLWNGLLGTVFRRRGRPFCTKTTPQSPTPRIKVRLQIWIRQTDADLRIRIPDPPHLQYKMEDLCTIIPIQTIWFTTIYLVDDGNIPIPVQCVCVCVCVCVCRKVIMFIQMKLYTYIHNIHVGCHIHTHS